MKKEFFLRIKAAPLRNRLTLMLVAVMAFGPAAGVANATANSRGPWPADAPEPLNIIPAILNVLDTLPFLFGEVDDSVIGVADSELTNVGLSGYDSTDPSVESDDNLKTPEDGSIYMSTSGGGSGNSGNQRDNFIVDNDRMQCPHAQYTTIQEAVTAAGAEGGTNDRDRIKVCPGTYNEQVRIVGPQYNNLKLFSRGARQAIIQAPSLMTGERSIVLVKGAANVEIRHFKIAGPSANIFAGVRVMDDVDLLTSEPLPGSALIRHNHITNIRTSTPNPDDGHAVNIGRNADGQTGTATVRHNCIDNYQRTGVFVDGGGSFAEVRHNDVAGGPQSNDFPQNGIQVSNFARAMVRYNRVTQNRFGTNGFADFDAVGILTFKVVGSETPQETDVLVSKNDVYLNEVGIGLDRETFQIEVSNNRSKDNDQDGIRAYAGGEAPVGAVPTDDSPSNQAEMNTISFNRMFGNDEHDCHDDTEGAGTSGTANFWIKNKGNTQNRLGLCKK